MCEHRNCDPMKNHRIRNTISVCLFTLAFLLAGVWQVEGATRTSTATGGTWATGSTWEGGTAPDSGDDVVIVNGATVTLGANTSIRNVTINAGGTLNISNRTLSISGNFVNNGNFTGSGGMTFTGAVDQSIDGFTTTGTVSMTKTAGTATFQGDVNAGALTINGNGGTLNLGSDHTHTFTGNWTRTAGTLNGGSSTLKIGGSVSGNSGTFDANSGTVEWNRAGNQTIAAVSYHIIILSGSGNKTISSGTTITNNLSIAPSGTSKARITNGLNIAVGSLTLGEDDCDCGSTWGSTSSSAANKTNTYFAATTGYITVGTMPNPYTVTGGGSYCAGESGVLVGLSESEVGVNYQLLMDGTPVGSAVAGTGSAISFGSQAAAGTYTIVGTRNNGGCTTNMTGSAVVSTVVLANPGNTLSTANPACANTPFTLSVQNPGTNVSYQWQTSPDGSSWSDIATNTLTLINTDFSSQPNNTNTYGVNTSVTGGELVLTTTVGGYIGGFVVQNTPGSNINTVTASFDYRISEGTGADGMSLSYAPNISDNAGGGEEGEGNGLIVKFDTYDNVSGQGTASQIRINYNSTLIWSNNLKSFDLRNSAYRTVNLSIDSNGYLSLSIGGTSIVNGLLLPGYSSTDKSDWKFKFSGRTGGSTDKHSIDNLSIAYDGNLSTNSTYTTSLTGSAYYRCKIYCGTNTVYSNPVQVIVSMPTFTVGPSAATCVETDVTYTTQPGQSNYIWSTSDTDYTITSGSLGTSSNSVTLKWLNAGSKTVSVTYTSSSGCSGLPKASSVTTVNSAPEAVTVSGGGTYCGNALLSASGGTGGTIYFQGTTSGGTSISTPAGSQTVSTSGTYYFRARSAQGCWSPEGSTTVIINPNPSTPVVGTITQPTCTVGTGSIALSGLPSSGNWTLTRQPGNVTTTGTGATTIITGLNPGTYYFTVANEDLGGNCPGSGDGLKAEYFNNMTLSGTAAMARTDATIDFNWGNGGPGSPINNDNFSVRWSGKIQPCYSETYTFYTQSDDGIRLWVNGIQVISNWTDHGSATNTGTINLTAGQKYDIVLEFYENGGQALAQLSWSSASQSQQIIPQSQLYSSINLGCTSPASANAVINEQPATPSAPVISFPNSATSACSGSSINLNAVSSGNTIYWYTTATGGTPIGTSASGASFEVFPNDGSVYYAESQSSFGCISPTRSATGTITLTSPSTAPTSFSGATTICSGNSTTLTLNGGSLGTGASWKWYSGNCGETLAGTGTSINVSPTSTTSYFVRAEGDCNVTGCATIVVTVNPQIVTNLIQPE